MMIYIPEDVSTKEENIIYEIIIYNMNTVNLNFSVNDFQTKSFDVPQGYIWKR